MQDCIFCIIIVTVHMFNLIPPSSKALGAKLGYYVAAFHCQWQCLDAYRRNILKRNMKQQAKNEKEQYIVKNYFF